MSTVVENFLRYVQIDTQSQPGAEEQPSTQKQFDLARLLVKELEAMGAQRVRLDERCYVYAEIPATIDEALPTLGFVAHMDTAPAVSGANVKPSVVKNYDGRDILLNAEKGVVLSPDEYKHLLNYVGDDLIVTDGTTLLGGDDKAGVAEIMAMAQYLLEHPELPHGRLAVAFTPDEEVGRGADGFDVEGFGADFAYTVDGSGIGELEYESFNAANAVVTVNGLSTHPGSAKGRMKNALLIAIELQSMLPTGQTPALTEGREGFFHLEGLHGDVEQTVMEYIIRDHSRQLFEQKKALFLEACRYLNIKHGEGTVQPELVDSYYNMREKILPHMHLVENARAAMEQLGITPLESPIRGGTDGSRLSYMGLPCPNLGTGSHNAHGRYEYASAGSMEKTVELLLAIVERYSKPAR